MSNFIQTNSILDPLVGQPFTGPSLNFLQNATKEPINGLGQAIIGYSYDPTITYILNGLTQSASTAYNEGYVLYQNEVFYSPGLVVTGFTNQPVLTLTTTNDSVADPLLFTDLVPRNVHNIRRMVLSDGPATGTSIALSSCTYVNESSIYTGATLYAQDLSGNTISSGLTYSNLSVRTQMTPNGGFIYVTCLSVTTISTVGVIGISAGIPIPYGKQAVGVSPSIFQKFNVNNSGLSVNASIALDWQGRGYELQLAKADASLFGVLSGYNFTFVIPIILL